MKTGASAVNQRGASCVGGGWSGAIVISSVVYPLIRKITNLALRAKLVIFGSFSMGVGTLGFHRRHRSLIRNAIRDEKILRIRSGACFSQDDPDLGN